MAIWPFQYVNQRGIPTIKAQSVVVSDTSVDFKFNPDWNSRPFRGLLLVYLAEEIPEGTTATLPIRFSMAGTTSNVTLPGGANLTAGDVTGTGVYLFYYDRFSDTLQLLSALPPATA
jgi:hypothetical protein